MLPFIKSKYGEKRLKGYVKGGYLPVQDGIDLDTFENQLSFNQKYKGITETSKCFFWKESD